MFDTNHFHPMFVHFPIALITVGFLADVLYLVFKKEHCLSKTGFYLMALGALAAIAAVFTGEFFTSDLQGEAGKIQDKHELFAQITMYVIIVATALRVYFTAIKKDETKFKWLIFVMYAIAMISVSITGYLGGTLVYNHLIHI
ncbi:MAG: DUF2231 domain-containing protein [Bacteroidetes bacterium]|nr:DUF2231 domain-containing protein [Bacteroidota bacterium]